MYITAIISFIGWFLFSIFGGVGLITLPCDLVSSFKNRPLPIGKEVYLNFNHLYYFIFNNPINIYLFPNIMIIKL